MPYSINLTHTQEIAANNFMLVPIVKQRIPFEYRIHKVNMVKCVDGRLTLHFAQ